MDMMLWVLFGAITAWIASIIVGYKSYSQLADRVITGTLGAVAAGFAMQNITGKPEAGINYFSLLVSVGGSLLFVSLAVYIKMQTHKKH